MNPQGQISLRINRSLVTTVEIIHKSFLKIPGLIYLYQILVTTQTGQFIYVQPYSMNRYCIFLTPLPQKYYIIASVRAFLHPLISPDNFQHLKAVLLNKAIIEKSYSANQLAAANLGEICFGILVPFIQAYIPNFQINNLINENLDVKSLSSVLRASNSWYACEVVQQLIGGSAPAVSLQSADSDIQENFRSFDTFLTSQIEQFLPDFDEVLQLVSVPTVVQSPFPGICFYQLPQTERTICRIRVVPLSNCKQQQYHIYSNQYQMQIKQDYFVVPCLNVGCRISYQSKSQSVIGRAVVLQEVLPYRITPNFRFKLVDDLDFNAQRGKVLNTFLIISAHPVLKGNNFCLGITRTCEINFQMPLNESIYGSVEKQYQSSCLVKTPKIHRINMQLMKFIKLIENQYLFLLPGKTMIDQKTCFCDQEFDMKIDNKGVDALKYFKQNNMVPNQFVGICNILAIPSSIIWIKQLELNCRQMGFKEEFIQFTAVSAMINNNELCYVLVIQLTDNRLALINVLSNGEIMSAYELNFQRYFESLVPKLTIINIQLLEQSIFILYFDCLIIAMDVITKQIHLVLGSPSVLCQYKFDLNVSKHILQGFENTHTSQSNTMERHCLNSSSSENFSLQKFLTSDFLPSSTTSEDSDEYIMPGLGEDEQETINIDQLGKQYAHQYIPTGRQAFTSKLGNIQSGQIKLTEKLNIVQFSSIVSAVNAKLRNKLFVIYVMKREKSTHCCWCQINLTSQKATMIGYLECDFKIMDASIVVQADGFTFGFVVNEKLTRIVDVGLFGEIRRIIDLDVAVNLLKSSFDIRPRSSDNWQ